MREMMKTERRAVLEDVFNAAKEAGQQLAKEGMIPEEILGAVSKPLTSETEYNKAFEEMVDPIKKSMGL